MSQNVVKGNIPFNLSIKLCLQSIYLQVPECIIHYTKCNVQEYVNFYHPQKTRAVACTINKVNITMQRSNQLILGLIAPSPEAITHSDLVMSQPRRGSILPSLSINEDKLMNIL